MAEIEIAKKLLVGDRTLVLAKGDKIYTSNRRGIRPLLDFLDTGADFSGFCAADKVVGRGAAFIYLALGVKSVYAAVISEVALDLLINHGVEVEYGTLVSRIINRSGDGFCPIESAVSDIHDTDTAIAEIRSTLLNL